MGVDLKHRPGRVAQNTAKIVIYYPYFIAEKAVFLYKQPGSLSGVDRTCGLVTYRRKDVTVIVRADGDSRDRRQQVPTPDEINELMRFGAVIRGSSGEISGGTSVLRNGAMRTTPISAGNRSGKGTLCFMNLGV